MRLPGGVHSLDGLWELLAGHRDAVTETADQRWDPKYFHLPAEQAGRGAGRNRLQRRLAKEQPGTIYTRAGGFLESLEEFDADFFGIGPREASRIDPQHRILLEVAWNALEDAGQSPDALAGTPVGVFVGISSNEYITLQYDDPGTVNPYTNSGGAFCMAANRLSYIFGLRGPSMSIDTACSSSLVAVHQACLSLWAGESTMALAGGVNALVKPAVSIGLCQAAMLSPSGRCRSFDAAADGYVRGEGCGLFVLKPLHRAKADQDRIYAVIRGSAVNSDGRTQGISLPSMEAQETLLRDVYKSAGVDPASVCYVEAHGTGTPAGDPIECAALGRVLGRGSKRSAPIRIGSVKSNLGHLEPASGAAGLAKALVCLAHRRVPANLHFENPNPAIPFADLGLKMTNQDLDLPRRREPLRIGVNSFGFGGANAHLIVEEYRKPKQRQAPDGAPRVPLFISARSERALCELGRAYRDLLQAPDAPALAAVVQAAALRRAHLTHRLAVYGTSNAEAAARLGAWLEDAPSPGVFSGREENPLPKLAFVFSGNGTQHWAMARQLLETDREFRNSIARIEEVFRPIAGWSIVEELLRDEASTRMAQTSFAQPALFAIQFALCSWLARRFVMPDAVVGHSVGEIAASCLADALPLQAALRVVAARSRVQERIAGRGAMAAAGLAAGEAERAIQPFAGKLSISAFNSPTSVTISGDARAIDELIAALKSRGVFARRLALNYPFHSHLLEGCEREFLGLAGDVCARAGTTQFASGVSGRLEEGTALDAAYWARNLRQPVRFREAVDTLLESGVRAFIEIGPHPALTGYLHECARARSTDITVFTTLNRKQADTASLGELLARLYAAGRVRDPGLLFEELGSAVKLPLYPWQRERHWNAPREGVVSAASGKAEHPLAGYALPGADRAWRGSIELEYLPYLPDHTVDGAVVFPASAYLEMALWTAHATFKRWPVEIEEFDILRPLVLDQAEPVTLLTSLGNEDGVLRIRSKVMGHDDEWALHAAGKASAPTGVRAPRFSLQDVLNRCTAEVSGERLYALARERGFDYGASFQLVEHIRAGRDEAVGRICPAASNGCLFHPAALDACLQVLLGLAARNGGGARGLFLPVHAGSFRLFGPPKDLAWCHAKIRSATARSILADFTLLDANGETLAVIAGFRFRALETAHGAPTKAALIEHTWTELPAAESAAADDAPTRTVLVFTGSPAASELGRALERRECRVVEAGPDTQDLRGLLDRLTGQGRQCQSVVYSGDAGGAVRLIQALNGSEWVAPPQLWLVTVDAWRGGVNPWQAALWGVGRVAVNEHPELGCRMVDLCGFERADVAAEALAVELMNPGAEDELLLEPGARHAGRIVPADWNRIGARRGASDAPSAFRLECGARGSIDSLSLARMTPPRPAPGQVLVRVRAAGLNFRDVMWTMGLLPPESLENGYAGVSLGIECAGEIEAVGDDVAGCSPGDRVMAFGANCFASHMVTGAAAVARMPDRLSYEEAATIPTVFLTCWYALREVARLAAGERVLIHGAAGGVGLAAIQIAQQAGAEIFATVGNDEKRALLGALGVKHVFDSRSLAFADQVLEATGGQGVDVVLNSLAGAAMEKSLKMLRPFGRFLEIGKRDLYANTRVGLRALRDNISYTAIDADQLLVHKPQLAARMLQEVSAQIESGALRPLVHRVFPAAQAAEAFRMMQQSRHVGKIVLSFDEAPDAAPPSAPDSIKVSGDGAYLVSGGLSGFGLATAEWLVARGARQIVLMGRRGASTPGCAEPIARMREAGAEVRVAAIDVSSEEAVQELIAELRNANTTVRGVIHAAMVLDDARILDLDQARFDNVFGPKALGAWNLHRQTLDCPLDFFVLYSSAAALFGNPHQANYAAGNLFLESLAEHRRAQGLPALAIGWGALDEVGYLARNPEVRQLLEAAAGVRPIPPAEALAALERLLAAGAGRATLLDIDWRKWRSNSPDAASPKYSALPAGDAPSPGGVAPMGEFLAGLDPAARRALLIERISHHLARILGLPAEKFDPRRPLASMGLDSLMAAELHTIIESETGLDLPLLRLLEQGSATSLADFVLRQMKE